MKTIRLILAIAVLSVTGTAGAQVLKAEKCTISFYSKTAMEDIDATNKSAICLLNTAKGDIVIKAAQSLFVFKSSFMQEHYNENYVESEKYPWATFTGKVNEAVDYTKDGVTKVTVTGTLNMHGVDQPRTISGTITVKDGSVSLDSNFDVKVADHKIKVPSLYAAKIAEVVQVTFHADMVPNKK